MKHRTLCLKSALAVLCSIQAGCMSYTPIPIGEIPSHEVVRVIEIDGTESTVKDPAIAADTICGVLVEPAGLTPQGPAAIPLDRVRDVRAGSIDAGKTIATGASSLLFIGGVVVLILAASEDVVS